MVNFLHLIRKGKKLIWEWPLIFKIFRNSHTSSIVFQKSWTTGRDNQYKLNVTMLFYICMYILICIFSIEMCLFYLGILHTCHNNCARINAPYYKINCRKRLVRSGSTDWKNNIPMTSSHEPGNLKIPVRM